MPKDVEDHLTEYMTTHGFGFSPEAMRYMRHGARWAYSRELKRMSSVDPNRTVEDLTPEELRQEASHFAARVCSWHYGDESGNARCAEVDKWRQEARANHQDATQLATLLDEMISHITFTEWERLGPELKMLGWKEYLLKELRDKYADRYRNV